MFCRQPFYYTEIYENGDVFTCCPPFINNFSIGNIYKQDFEKIWNGKKIQKIRKNLLKDNFNLCSNSCIRKFISEEKTEKDTPIVENYPEELSISSDNSCNINCKICRDNIHTVKQSNFKEDIDKYWLPVFKNAKLVRFGCTGEPFASKKEKYLIQKLAEIHPNIKFQFHTNGILGDKNLLKKLDVYNKIDIMTVSLHSATEETYNKTVIGGNYKKVMKNLKLYSEMKQDSLIKFFRLIFVVYSENYKDMRDFAKMAEKLDAEAQFWAYRKNDTEIGRNYEKYAITEKSHKEHNKLVKILKDDIFKSKNVVLYPELKALTEE